MAVTRRDTRGRFLLTAVIVSSLLLITIDSGNGSGVVASLRSTAHNIIAPVQSVVNDAFQPLRDVAGGITTYGSLKTENDRLRRQISDLRGQLRQIRGVGNELPQLEKLLDLPTVEDATGIVARVTAGAPGNFERTVTIDKGSNQGLRVGYPVVTGDGLVGTITQVAGRSATVILLDSPTLGVGVRLTTSNTEGITVAKAGERDLTIGFLSDPTVKAQKGELVLTSASANEAFPPDLVVGTVVGYSKPLQDLAPTITVAPAVNLDNLDFVKVLRFPDPTAAPRGG
jgi:rod shape-determining protein MreC